MKYLQKRLCVGLVQLLLVLALITAVSHSPAYAQEPQKPDIDSLRRDVAAIEAATTENAENDDKLLKLRGQADALSGKLIAFGVSFRPQLKDIAAKLNELGPAPGDGQPAEASQAADLRKQLTAQKAQINAQLADAEGLSIRLADNVDRIAELRRELFTRTLFRRTEASGAFGPETTQAFSEQVATAWRTLRSRVSFMDSFRPGTLYTAIGAALAVALALMLATRKFTQPASTGAFVDEKGNYVARLSLAFWSTVMPSLAVAAALAILWAALAYFSVFVGQSLEITYALVVSAAALFFIQRLCFAVFSPAHSHRRLLAITDRGAWALVGLTVLMAIIYVVDYFLNQLDEISSAPLSLTVAKALVASLSISLILILIALVRPFNGEDRHERPWPAIIRVPLILLAGIVIASAMSGYIGLARFLAAQIVVTSAILVTMYIGWRFGRALSKEGGFAQTGLGVRVKNRFGLSEQGADLAGLAVSLLVYIIVLGVGLPLIALQWGFKWAEISAWLVQALTDIRIGSFRISLLSVLFGAVIFAIGLLLTRRFQRWLDSDVMRRSRVDAGLRNSIRTVAGYAGIGAAALIGISAAGFNLSNLALIAGALSLGIGFGLQNIVNNFVSGLILLVERPFRVGDWVVAGNVTGIVRKISRARHGDRDIQSPVRDPAEFRIHQQRGFQLDTAQQSWPRRHTGRCRLRHRSAKGDRFAPRNCRSGPRCRRAAGAIRLFQGFWRFHRSISNCAPILAISFLRRSRKTGYACGLSRCLRKTELRSRSRSATFMSVTRRPRRARRRQRRRRLRDARENKRECEYCRAAAFSFRSVAAG